MSQITDPATIQFCQQMARPFCNLLAKLNIQGPAFNSVYNAQGIGSAINSEGAGNVIADGFANAIVGGDIYNFITLLTDFATFLSSNDGSGNNRTTIIDRIQTTGLVD